MDINTVYKLSKTYDNDGADVSEVDLTGLKEADTAMYIKAYNTYNKMGYTEFPPERTEEFAEIIGNLVTDLPIEFFDDLLAADMRGVTNLVRKIIYSKPNSEEKENIIKLCRPVTDSSGKKTDKLDLSGIGSMTTLTLKRANAVLRKRGIYISGNKEFDIRYTLAVAESLTGVDDLSRTAIQDGIEIRNIVANFFVFGG